MSVKPLTLTSEGRQGKTKMKQASVDMICHYSQKSRMEEVAKLLKLAKYYVLEAGYRLVFTTLSD
jgi:hypothetical protein